MTDLHQRLTPFLIKVSLQVDSVGEEGQTLQNELRLSGVILNKSGLFVAPTPPSSKINVANIVLHDGENRQARLLRSDPQLGLSIYKTQEFDFMGPNFAPCRNLRPGTVAISMGNSFGMEPSLDMGYIAGTQRCVAGVSGLLQLTNTVNPGDGGGLVADRHGRIIGVLMTSLREAALREQQRSGKPDALGLTRSESISFAVPSDRILMSFAKELGLPSSMPRPRMGVMVQLNDAQQLEVKQVLPGSAAAESGLLEGDILLQLGDSELHELDSLLAAILSSPVEAELIGLRANKKFTAQIKFRY